ncbi:hypothetical protein BAUCODRAFT_78815 [Baudoinia panamericana UAMH 10762]|uniref:UNC-45/Cro1/She4 central domain-containing protein n=1 Tax=Baudoinia panamericana (strain UAMH 10762) TaxID=717646 RepID=M2LD50_BAUPA|nr:uncharacterized protein BAUCODRAFT_78815 [Baudoinia panamericana UAMH 10762]EMC91882.1 hypothetical protein BAUCODRAFT_78815 [Baudoinia panamericana UAMH 10762]
MTSAVEDRLAHLLTLADDALRNHEQAKAASILREAAQIDSSSDAVKQRWLRLSSNAPDGFTVLSVQRYVVTGRPEDAPNAVKAIRYTQFSSDEAIEAYTLLIESQPEISRRDELLSLLVHCQYEARKAIAAKLVSDSMTVIAEMFHVGAGAFDALVVVILERPLWSSSDQQATVQKAVFCHCIEQLQRSDGTTPRTRALRGITRQLAVQPENAMDLLDGDAATAIFLTLDLRLEESLRSQGMITTSKMLEVTKKKGERFFADFVRSRVAIGGDEDLIPALSAAAMVFPLLPVVAAKLLLTDGVIEQLVYRAEKPSVLEKAILELLNAACVDRACREAIKKHCTNWLNKLSAELSNPNRALAVLLLTKMCDDTIDDVTSSLSDMVIHNKPDRERAIEGLAYASLQPTTKEKIINDATLLRSLTDALRKEAGALFGCLTIFANLTAHRQVQSDEQKKMAQLKAYANASKPTKDDPLDDEQHVTARCKKLLDADIVAALVACSKQVAASPTNILLIVRILLALAKEQKHRSKMAQQGAVKLLLQSRDRVANATDTETAKTASHALARLLISLNPAHVFTSALPVSSAVSALIPLLKPPDAEGEDRDRLPTFEALLALTNLASMDDPAARELIIRDCFEAIEELLFSPTLLIQRATVELVCNLMASPSCAAAFADPGSKDAKRRLQILLALTDVEDLATRRAAGGAVAMLTEWGEDAVGALVGLGERKGVKSVVRMCADESGEVVIRGLVCLKNSLGADERVVRENVAEMVREVGGVDVVKEGLRKNRSDAAVLQAGVEVLKMLG